VQNIVSAVADECVVATTLPTIDKVRVVTVQMVRPPVANENVTKQFGSINVLQAGNGLGTPARSLARSKVYGDGCRRSSLIVGKSVLALTAVHRVVTCTGEDLIGARSSKNRTRLVEGLQGEAVVAHGLLMAIKILRSTLPQPRPFPDSVGIVEGLAATAGCSKKKNLCWARAYECSLNLDTQAGLPDERLAGAFTR
jgi:hypothetical protein